jgi:exocyst complex component 8
MLGHKLTTLTSLLTASLLNSLSLPTIRKSAVVFLISLLLRLNAGLAARNCFLEMRTKVLKAHVRKIRFEGHVGAYVGDLAVVYFTGIKHTADWFLASFKENEVSSGLSLCCHYGDCLPTEWFFGTAFVNWARKQLEDFAETFRRQVYTSDVEPMVVDGAMKIAFTQSKKVR